LFPLSFDPWISDVFHVWNHGMNDAIRPRDHILISRNSAERKEENGRPK
jgi:hypothetical protein